MKLATIQDHHPLPFESQNLQREMEAQNVETKRLARPVCPQRGELLHRVIQHITDHGPLEHWQIAHQLEADHIKVRAALGYLVGKKRIENIEHKYHMRAYPEVRS